MPNIDPRIDAYIAKAQPFARPILEHLRMLIHKACPEVEETIKWGMPAFYYKGPMVGIAAFKAHAVVGFWKGKLLKDPKNYLGERSADGGEAMGQLGRITKLSDLPPDRAMLDFIKQAKKLNEEGVKLPPKEKKPKTPLKVPPYMMTAIKKNKKALNTFESFSYSHKKEYVEWITEAKTDATREKRLGTAIEWMAAGKGRNWKYLKK